MPINSLMQQCRLHSFKQTHKYYIKQKLQLHSGLGKKTTSHSYKLQKTKAGQGVKLLMVQIILKETGRIEKLSN